MLIRGDARSTPLRDETVQCVVTSPPYWGLRDYGFGKDALGLEPTPELYVQHVVEIFREIRRVLRPDGTVWLNMGDSFYQGGKGNSGELLPSDKQSSNAGSLSTRRGDGLGPNRKKLPTNNLQLKALDRCDIPGDVARALRADGWYWRQTIIWEKANPMPESVNGWRWERHRMKTGRSTATQYKPAGWDSREQTHDALAGNYQDRQHEPTWQGCPGCEKCTPNDGLVLRKGAWRPATAHEYIFLLTKSDTYYCDAEAVKEPSDPANWRYGSGERKYESGNTGLSPRTGLQPVQRLLRNLRSVWRFPSQAMTAWACVHCGHVSDPRPPNKQCPQCGTLEWVSHFAAFPEELPERCIRAGTSEKGCCPKCGAPWARVLDGKEKMGWSQTLGWRATCQCNASDPIPCLVLDPFAGTGTVGRVAERLNRRWVCLDLKYHALSAKRTTDVQKELANF